MTNYRNGADFERTVKTDLETDGYWCIRAAGSKGKIDILAIKNNETLAVQVKRNGQVRPAERLELIKTAESIGALPIIAYKIRLRTKPAYARLIGPGPKDRQPFYTDEIGTDHE